MFGWFDWSAVLIILQLVYLEGILSIDNAAVLGAMVSHLPHDEPVPWPRPLRFLQRPIHLLLGGQRTAALKAGLLGAYLGRGTMLFAASWVVRNQWLLLLGGGYLIYLALSHFGGEAAAAEQRGNKEQVAVAVRMFWAVVINVELADMAFSLDNVVAAVALSRATWVVLTGVFLGIVTMRFAAGLFVRLIEREPVLEAAAYLLVLVIGFEVLAEDLLHVQISHAGKFVISVSVLVATLLYARSRALQALGRRCWWVRPGLAAVNGVLHALARPARWAGHSLVRLGALAIAAVGGRRAGTVPGSSSSPWSGGDGRR